MRHAVVQLGELGLVPAVGRPDEITRDALELIQMMASALGADLEVRGGVFVSAIHAPVPVMVHRAVAHVVAVHHIDHLHDDLRVVRRVAIQLDVEDMPAARQVVIRGFDLRLMPRATFIIYRHVVRVRVILAVGNAGERAEALAVPTGEFARQALGRRGQDAIVMLVLLGELVHPVAHIGDDFQS